MKQLYIILLLCLSTLLHGQNKKLGISIGTSGFFIVPSKIFSKHTSNWNIYTTKELGLSYNLIKKNQIGVNLSFWKNAFNDKSALKDIVVFNSKVSNDTLANLPFSRTKYKYLDILWKHELLVLKRHFYLNLFKI